MSRTRIHNLAISLDGFATREPQSTEAPFGHAGQRLHDLAFVSGLLESGEVVPVVDRCYPLRELPEALRYRAAGHARGKIVITMEHTSE
jgi:NADPH:quinone reductase-like Zn-dependent oxidoreductase